MSAKPDSTPVARTVMTTIFFMWGVIASLNDAQSKLIQFTFFGACVIMSLPSGEAFVGGCCLFF